MNALIQCKDTIGNNFLAETLNHKDTPNISNPPSRYPFILTIENNHEPVRVLNMNRTIQHI